MGAAVAVYVLDTTAIIAFLERELEYEKVGELLRAAEAASDLVLMPFIALMEVEYRHWRVMSEDDVEYWTNVILGWPITLIESTSEWRRTAAFVKSQGGLSLADAWVAALALMNDAELVHKDPEFDAVPSLKAIRLPYDRDIRRGNV